MGWTFTRPDCSTTVSFTVNRAFVALTLVPESTPFAKCTYNGSRATKYRLSHYYVGLSGPNLTHHLEGKYNGA